MYPSFRITSFRYPSFHCLCRRAIIFFAVYFAISHSMVVAGDWPHWRGPNRNDIVAESSGFNGKDWQPKEIWRGSFGEGSTSPIVVQGKLYTLGWKQNRDHIYCIDAATGKELWQQSYPSPRFGRVAAGDQNQYSGPSGTPEFDETTGLLYTLSNDGALNCWDTSKKGTNVWRLNLYEAYKAPRRPEVAERGNTRRDYGYTTAPLLQGDTLVVEVGCKEGTLIGFDKRTGKQLWTSQCRDVAGHSGGPVPMTVAGVRCVAVLTLRGLLVTRIDEGHEGKTVAQFKWTTDFANNIPTPAVQDNFVILTSAYNHVAVCKVRIDLDGATKMWETKRLASGVCSPIIHEGNVYWAWNGIRCVDFETGKLKWTGRGIQSAGSCILTSDNRLIIWGNRGDLILADTAKQSPRDYHEIVRHTDILRATAWPHIILANGHLYCRDRDGNIVCLQLPG